MSARGIILVVFFLGSLPVCFFRPFYGLFLWTIVAFVNPQSYTWGAATALPWAVLAGVPTLAGMVLFSRGWRRLASREAILLMVIWLWFTVTTIISTSTPQFAHHAADTWYRWNVVSKIFLMTLATFVIIEDFRQFHVFMRVLAGCFGVFVAKGVPFILLTGGQHRIYGPPNSMIADNNDFGLAINMTAPIFFFMAQIEEKPWVRALFWTLFAMAIPTVLFTYSRGALLGLVVIMAAMLLQSRQRLLLIPVLLGGLVLGLVLAPEKWMKRMDPTKKGAIDKSAMSRINAWTFAWRLAQDHPLTGGGFATWTPQLFARYAPDATDVHAAHSIYFQVLGEHGFPGLLLFLSLAISCQASAWRLRRRARDELDPEVAAYADMVRFAMLGFLTSGLFLGRAYFDYYYALVAALAVLREMAWREWRQEQPEESAAEAEAAPDDGEFVSPDLNTARPVWQ